MTDILARLKEALADRYRFERQLGAGGWATVYLAQDLKHGRQVAVKVLRPEVASALGWERFLREIQIAARLRHPNILPLYDSGDAGGLLYYVMPYVEGESLRVLLDRDKQLSLETALRIAHEVADGLAVAHEQGVVHRDIKPENILIDAGHAVVTDFGIARAVMEAGGDRLTETGIAIGTPAYMSPEQAMAESEADTRSDVYSLGCVIYEMLVGEPPFAGPTMQVVMVRRMTETVPKVTASRDSVPGHVEAVVSKALAKVPADRFASAQELAEALSRARTSLHESPVGTPMMLTGPAKPSRWSLIGASGGAIALVVAIWLVIRILTADGSSSLAGRVLVVSPFTNLSGDSGQKYVAVGISDVLIAELFKVGDLTVVSGEPDRLPADVTDEAFLLEGSVLPADQQVRINARLTEAGTGATVWADFYVRDVRDVLRLQAEVARLIAVAVEANLTPQEEALLSSAPQVDPEAFNLYLRGRNQWRRRTPEGLLMAVEFLQQALAIDSSSALTYAGLADAYALFPLYGVAAVTRAEAYALAERHARAALERDSTLGEARTALAHVLFLAQRDWSGAETEFERALGLLPGYATLHQWYGEFLRARGQVEESRKELRRAYELAPLDPVVGVALAGGLWVAGDYEAAVIQAQSVLDELYPGYVEAYLTQGLAYLSLEQFDEMAMAAQSAGFPAELATGVADALTGRGTRADAIQVIASFEPVLLPFHAAAFYAAIGANERALDALERAEAAESVNLLIYLKAAPVFRGLRDEPRYRELLEQLGVPGS